jgi:hypothetical protein
MSMKSKLSTTALLALVAMGALATTSAKAGWLFVPENATTFCDDVRFSCGSYPLEQHGSGRYVPPPPKHHTHGDVSPDYMKASDPRYNGAMSYAGGGGGGGGAGGGGGGGR